MAQSIRFGEQVHPARIDVGNVLDYLALRNHVAAGMKLATEPIAYEPNQIGLVVVHSRPCDH